MTDVKTLEKDIESAADFVLHAHEVRVKATRHIQQFQHTSTQTEGDLHSSASVTTIVSVSPEAVKLPKTLLEKFHHIQAHTRAAELRGSAWFHQDAPSLEAAAVN